MSISPESQIGQEIISRSHTLFKGMGGAIVPFGRLCSIFQVVDEGSGAEIAELLCRRDVKVLKHVYFFLDQSDTPIQLKDSIVHNFIRTGELYNPISNELVDAADADEFIIIEFEVLA